MNWWYQRTADRPVQELCVNGELIAGNAERFSLNPDNYELTLLSAKWTDNGLYSCVEDTAFGTRHVTRLILRGIELWRLCMVIYVSAICSKITRNMRTKISLLTSECEHILLLGIRNSQKWFIVSLFCRKVTDNRQWRRYVVAKQCKCTTSLLPCTASCTACILTRKTSCRWQTRATLAKWLHSLCKSSGVVSCIAS